jgi:DNA-binding PadR family transcriptional regulator
MDYEKHLPLAPRDLLILSVLAEGPLHGYGIIKAAELRSRSGVLLDPANLYRVLRRMRRVGWIREAGGSDDSRRKAYQITATGKAILSAELKRLERLLRHARPAVAGAPGFSDPRDRS